MKRAHPHGPLVRSTLSAFIRTTFRESFLSVQEILPRRNAKNTKRSLSISAISAFFCGYSFGCGFAALCSSAVFRLNTRTLLRERFVSPAHVGRNERISLARSQ